MSEENGETKIPPRLYYRKRERRNPEKGKETPMLNKEMNTTYEDMIVKASWKYAAAKEAKDDGHIKAYEKRASEADGFCDAIAMMFGINVADVCREAGFC